MGFQGVFEEKGEEQEILTFYFLAVEALSIGQKLRDAPGLCIPLLTTC